MTALKTYINLWTLWDHPVSGAAEWSVSRSVSAIAQAGFDDAMGDVGQGHWRAASEKQIAFHRFQPAPRGRRIPCSRTCARYRLRCIEPRTQL